MARRLHDIVSFHWKRLQGYTSLGAHTKASVSPRWSIRNDAAQGAGRGCLVVMHMV